jgi:hypothetical protein
LDDVKMWLLQMDIDAQLLLQKAHTSTSSIGAATA